MASAAESRVYVCSIKVGYQEFYALLDQDRFKESVRNFLVTDLDGTYIDATFGGGGHSREILSRLRHDARVFAFDVDVNSQRTANAISSSDDRLSFVKENFSQIGNFFEDKNLKSAAGFLFDLGVSSYQIDNESGFSYRRDEKLDMRLDKSLKASAYDVINLYDVGALAECSASMAKSRAHVRLQGLSNIGRKTRLRPRRNLWKSSERFVGNPQKLCREFSKRFASK